MAAHPGQLLRRPLVATRGLVARGLAAGGLAAVAVALGAATAVLPPRWWVVLLVAALAALLSTGLGTGYLLACAAIPFVAGLRRVTGGPTGYVEGDPLILLPVVLAAPTLLVIVARGPRGRDSRLLLVAVAALLVSALVAAVTSPVAAAFALGVQLTPVLIALALASGQLPGLVPTLRRVLLVTSPVAAGYAVVQRLAPPAWDLAWLQDRSAVLTSVGEPVTGGFRVFGSMESPAPMAFLLALGSAAHLLAALGASSPSPGRPRRPAAAAGHLALVVLLVGAASLTSVRAALFALPIAVLLWLMASRRVRLTASLVVAAVLVAVVLTVPAAVGNGGTSPGAAAARYDLRSIAQDTSFEERVAILPGFAAAVQAPLGTGLGVVGTSSKLRGGDVNTVDNGYLARLQEQGLLGGIAFVLVLGAALWRGAALTRSSRDDATDLSLAVVLLFALFELGGPAVAGSLGFYFWPAVGHLLATRAARPATVPQVSPRASTASSTA